MIPLFQRGILLLVREPSLLSQRMYEARSKRLLPSWSLSQGTSLFKRHCPNGHCPKGTGVQTQCSFTHRMDFKAFKDSGACSQRHNRMIGFSNRNRPIPINYDDADQCNCCFCVATRADDADWPISARKPCAIDLVSRSVGLSGLLLSKHIFRPERCGEW